MTSASVCPCRIQPAISPVLNDTDQPQLQQQQNLAYADCCQPLHQGTAYAKTAEQLMRSRYSAFVMCLTDYIVDTTVPAQQASLDKSSIERWAKETQWAGLQILQHRPKLGKRHAQVEFNAYFHHLDQGTLALDAHHELSGFVLIDNKWYFLDPTVTMPVTQKQPCICGSGEKFKRCCGPFI
ncbi:YchJ family protein [Psychrobacter sp. FDAARGOS_221]|uniref:YchJ family protein n=1 Tax=Psychrobacter sp. FDAARGOS_221 TaxID=1975705 RepID=UPI000BB54AC2|nr:YchJ family protein [Psychrobacter sp. FDAARGOS_221]PNK60856.1 hypothetical protein A6J60_008170 [Psychrobacter sp. FDAARGOS_221]